MYLSKKNILIIILLVIFSLFLVIYFIIKTKNNQVSKKINCIPNCLKKCNGESDGCGNLCTCPYGNYCTTDGNCINDCDTCSAGLTCDNITGRCKCDSSKCPDYQTCQEDDTCGYTCLPKCDSGETCLFDGNCCAQKCGVGQICTTDGSCGCNMNTCKKYSKICNSSDGLCKDFIIVVIGVDKNGIGGFIYVSKDQGNSWTKTQPTNCINLSDIAYNEFYFVTVGNGVWFSSDNATNWTQNNDSTLTNLECSRISWCESKNLWFLSVHDPSQNHHCVYTSEDPTKSWNKHKLYPFDIGYNVTCMGEYLIAGGNRHSSNSNILIGKDIDKMTVANSSLTTLCSKIECNNSGICVAVGDGLRSTIVYTQDTNIGNWTDGDDTFEEAFCVTSNYKGFFVAGGSNKKNSSTTIMYSSDGISWKPSDTTIFSRRSFLELGGVFGIASVGDYYFAVGKGPTYSIAVSKDYGKTWVPNTTSVSVNSVLYGIAIKLVS